jgi:hypothetical protein
MAPAAATIEVNQCIAHHLLLLRGWMLIADLEKTPLGRCGVIQRTRKQGTEPEAGIQVIWERDQERAVGIRRRRKIAASDQSILFRILARRRSPAWHQQSVGNAAYPPDCGP